VEKSPLPVIFTNCVTSSPHLAKKKTKEAVMATVYKVHEAKTHLSRLLEQMEAGEEVVIARGSAPVARLVPHDAVIQPKPKRVPGTRKTSIPFDDRFFDPLPEEELRRWEGSDA
jgi:prevent-host-death family protein